MHVYIKLIVSLLLIFCIADIPYVFYQFVHFISFLAFGYFAYDERDKQPKWVVFYIIIAILFQPFIKISFDRVLWNVVDIIVVFILLISLIKSNRKINVDTLEKIDSFLIKKNLSRIDFYTPKYDNYIRKANLINQQKIISENFESIKFNEVYVFGIRTLSDVYDFEFIRYNFSHEKIKFGFNKNLYLIQIIDDRIDLMSDSIKRFIDYAISCNDRKFCVVSIPVDENIIIPLFAKAFNVCNIYLPKKYVDFFSNTIDPFLLNDFQLNGDNSYFLNLDVKTKDCQAIKKYFPGYLKYFFRLYQEYNIDIVSEFDSLIYQSLVNSFNFNQHLITLIEEEKSEEKQVLLKDFLAFINGICSQCGSNKNVSLYNNILVSGVNFKYINFCYNCYSKLNNEEYFITTSINLWITFNKNLTNLYASNFDKFYLKEIRFISNTGEIDFAKFGYYFYHKGELYIISNNPKYAEFNIKNTIQHEMLIDNCYDNYFVFKSNYAGHYSGFNDFKSIKLYTGDIVKIKINSYSLVGIVVSGVYKGSNLDADFELYEVISNFNYTNNFWVAFLKDATQIEVYSNIFSILDKYNNVNINEVAEISARLNKDISQNTFTLDGENIYITDNLKFLKVF